MRKKEIRKVTEFVRENPQMRTNQIVDMLWNLEKERRKKCSDEETQMHKAMSDIWDAKYTAKTQMNFFWTAGDKLAVKEIAKKIAFSLSQKGNFDGIENIVASFTLILERMDFWHWENGLDLKILNHRYNRVIGEIKTNKKNTTDAEFARAIERNS